MALVNQSSKLPTRKIMAVILSGMIVGGLQSALNLFWPDHPFAPFMEDFDIWVQGVIMILAGYMTKEKNVDVSNTNSVEKSDSVSGDGGVPVMVDVNTTSAGKAKGGEQSANRKGNPS